MLVRWTIVAVSIGGALVYALYVVRQALLLIYVSALLAIGFSPLVRLIERQRLLVVGMRRVPRWLAILVIYVAMLTVIAAAGFVVFPPFIKQARDFVGSLPKMFDHAEAFLVKHHVLSESVTLGEFMQQSPGGGDVVGTVLLTVWTVLGGLFGVLTVLILTFYLLVESGSLFDGALRLVPRKRRPHAHAVSREITLKLSGWLSGQLMLAAIICVTSAVGLGLIGIPYFYVLALLAAVGELIPYVGPILGAIPGIAIALNRSWQLALVVTTFYFVQQQLESNLLVPKLMERQVGLSAATVLIALLIGASLLGTVGAILAVPTAAIANVLYQEFVPNGTT